MIKEKKLLLDDVFKGCSEVVDINWVCASIDTASQPSNVAVLLVFDGRICDLKWIRT